MNEENIVAKFVAKAEEAPNNEVSIDSGTDVKVFAEKRWWKCEDQNIFIMMPDPCYTLAGERVEVTIRLLKDK